MHQTVTLAREFELETYRIDQAVWDAMALRAGESVLFCGFANNGEWIKRAAAVGVNVSVISDDSAAIAQCVVPAIAILRGSCTMIPARDASYDATVAFHYLHEVDPLFHANIVGELARVGKRCIVVEPAPPSDPLGTRIAALYSRAKRELGQFENYHHSEYWRKLLAIAKSNVSHQTFTYRRTPPRAAIRDTVRLIIDTMAAEKAPAPYIAELRALAARPEAQLLPQARHVIVGMTVGEPKAVTPGTSFRDWTATDTLNEARVQRFVPPTIGRPPAPVATPARLPGTRVAYNEQETEAELPLVERPAAAALTPPNGTPSRFVQTVPASQIARNAFGLGGNTPAAAADEESFASAPQPAAESVSEDFGWEWEAP